VLLEILAGDADIIPDWLKFGGAECAAQLRVDVDADAADAGGGRR
jgi:hypothetical protein